MKYLVLLVLLFPSLVLAVDDATVQAIDSKASNASSKADGNNSRIQALEAEDVILHNRISTIELMPGPKGEKGDPGSQGPQGLPGAGSIQVMDNSPIPAKVGDWLGLDDQPHVALTVHQSNGVTDVYDLLVGPQGFVESAKLYYEIDTGVVSEVIIACVTTADPAAILDCVENELQQRAQSGQICNGPLYALPTNTTVETNTFFNQNSLIVGQSAALYTVDTSTTGPLVSYSLPGGFGGLFAVSLVYLPDSFNPDISCTLEVGTNGGINGRQVEFIINLHDSFIPPFSLVGSDGISVP